MLVHLITLDKTKPLTRVFHVEALQLFFLMCQFCGVWSQLAKDLRQPSRMLFDKYLSAHVTDWENWYPNQWYHQETASFALAHKLVFSEQKSRRLE